MNAVFIFAGVLVESVFVSLSKLYFRHGAEEGFYRIPSIEYFGLFLLIWVSHTIVVLCYGLIENRMKDEEIAVLCSFILFISFKIKEFDLKLILIFIIQFIILLVILRVGLDRKVFNKIRVVLLCVIILSPKIFKIDNTSFLKLAIITFLYFFAFIFIKHLKGSNLIIPLVYKCLLIVSFIICASVLFIYEGGVLLTQEVTAFFNLLILLAGLILSFSKKRFGLYLIEYISILMFFSYLMIYIENKILSNLFIIIPLAIVGFTTLFVNYRLDLNVFEEGKNESNS